MRINFSNFCWQNASTIMLTAYIDGFKRNWWTDKQEYHTHSLTHSLYARRYINVVIT